MKTDNFSKRFFSICGGISLVLISSAAFTYSIKSSEAATPVTKSIIQTGTAENYIPIQISNGYAYWLVFNTTDGYKFRKASITSGKWEEK